MTALHQQFDYHSLGYDQLVAACEARDAEIKRLNELVADHEEVHRDHHRLVRELDVLLNGEAGAAKQASLCDIVGQLAAQKRHRPSNQWVSLAERQPPKDCARLLVTNNITARDAYDHFCHLWLVHMVHKQDDGSFAAFDDHDRKIHGLTHWRYAVPEESSVETPAPLTYVTKVEPHHDRMAIGGRIVMMEQVYDKLGIPRPALKTTKAQTDGEPV